jgi:hypothetical protein
MLVYYIHFHGLSTVPYALQTLRLSLKVENMFLKFQICLISLDSSRDVEMMTECFVVLERDAALDEFALSRLHL